MGSGRRKNRLDFGGDPNSFSDILDYLPRLFSITR